MDCGVHDTRENSGLRDSKEFEGVSFDRVKCINKGDDRENEKGKNLASRVNVTLQRLQVLLESPGSTDALLCTIAYTLKLTCGLVQGLLDSRIRQATTRIAEKSSHSLRPGETLVITGAVEDVLCQVGELPRQWIAVSDVLSRIKNLEGLISDYRVFVRLWGLIGLLQWMISHWQKGYEIGNCIISNHELLSDEECKEKPSVKDKMEEILAHVNEDTVVRRIIWGQIYLNIVYQVLENGAYLAQHNVLRWSQRKQSLAWKYSSRCWAAHVFLDIVRLGRILQLIRQGRKQSNFNQCAWLLGDTCSRTHNGEKSDLDSLHDYNVRPSLSLDVLALRREVYTSLLTNSAYAPLTLHFSANTGFLTPVWVGTLGLIAGIIRLRRAWANTQQ